MSRRVLCVAVVMSLGAVVAGCKKSNPAGPGSTPVAGTVIVNPTSAVAGQSVALSVTGASDPAGLNLTYSWAFGDGQNGAGATTSHAYNSPGTFTVTLTVSNGTNSATATATVTVTANSPPTAGSVTAPTTTQIAGTPVTFTSTGASDPNGQTLTYSWNFGDGTTGSGQTNNHTFTAAGTFTVSVTVSDGSLSATTSGVAVVVKSLTGLWRGTVGVDSTVNLTQSGSTISGTFNAIDLSGSIAGSISPTRRVTWTVTLVGFQPFTYAADPDADVNTLNGTANGSGFVNEPWILKRQ